MPSKELLEGVLYDSDNRNGVKLLSPTENRPTGDANIILDYFEANRMTESGTEPTTNTLNGDDRLRSVVTECNGRVADGGGNVLRIAA